MCQVGEIGGVDMLTSPFSNIKVVDLSSYIAGALCPGLLADFGASVIKVESLDRRPFSQPWSDLPGLEPGQEEHMY